MAKKHDCELFSCYLERMVAAYVIGYSITKDDLEANPALKFAEGADDLRAGQITFLPS